MQIEWMEQIAGQLTRIAEAHERVAAALEHIAKSARVISTGELVHLLEGTQDPPERLQSLLKQWEDEWLRCEAGQCEAKR